jgi:tetratricopeptide (TPR) repeat protein
MKAALLALALASMASAPLAAPAAADLAVDRAQAATRVAPQSVEAWRLLGEAYQAKRDDEAALGALERGERLDPKNVGLLVDHGLSEGRLGRRDAALDDYGAALAIQPDSGMAHFGRAVVLEDQGHDDRAIRDLDDALRINPRDALAIEQRAAIYARIDDFLRAADDLTLALKLDPSNAALLRKRAQADIELGDVAAADADIDAARALDLAAGVHEPLHPKS